MKSGNAKLRSKKQRTQSTIQRYLCTPKIDPRAHRTKSLTQAREEGEKAQRDSEYQPDQDGLTLQHVQEEIEEEQDKNPNT